MQMALCKWHKFWMTSFFIVLYIERKWVLIRNSAAVLLPLKSIFNSTDGSIEMRKMVEFPKVSIKIKNYKAIYEVQTVSCLKKIIQPPPNPTPHQIKFLEQDLERVWNKNFLTEIYRNIQTFAFKVFQKCSSWESRNGAVQMFFSNTKQKHFAGKFVKSERLLAVLQEHIFFNVKWVEVHKMSVKFFEWNCIVIWVSFSLVFVDLETSVRKSEIKK